MASNVPSTPRSDRRLNVRGEVKEMRSASMLLYSLEMQLKRKILARPQIMPIEMAGTS